MANKRPPVELEGLDENLKHSSGKGIDAFFSTLPSPNKEQQPPDTSEKAKAINTESNTIHNIKSNIERNTENNVVSNIIILQFTDKDIEELRELAEKAQTYRLTHHEVEYVKDMSHKLTKESKRGKIGQGDILRIALVLFDKFITSNKNDLKVILEKMK
jgi:hypothetical protein